MIKEIRNSIYNGYYHGENVEILNKETHFTELDFIINRPATQKEFEKQEKEKTDCRTEEGITVGLIDSIIFISRVLADRMKNKQTKAIREALKDLQSDKDLAYILND